MGLTRPNYNNIDTSKFEIDDPLTEINTSLKTGSNLTDIGFIFKRGTSGDNAAFLWDRSALEFALITTTATGDTVGSVPIAGYSNLQIQNLISNKLLYPTVDGTNGQVIVTDGNGVLSFGSSAGGTEWGTITGTLADQTDLNSELNTKLTDTSDINAGLY